jgi:hypothetical protein
MLDIEKYDIMMCNTKANMTFQHKKENDNIFFQVMGNTQPTQVRDVGREFMIQNSRQSRQYICTPSIDTRGGNSVSCAPGEMYQGYANYNNYAMADYLMTPCKTNTFKNHVSCDEDKCCSVHHQLFNNMTKRT